MSLSAMDLDDVNGIEEHPEHFVVHHERRGSFKLAKSVIPDDVQASIRSVAAGKAAALEALANSGTSQAATGALVSEEDPGVAEAQALRAQQAGQFPESVAPAEQPAEGMSLVDIARGAADVQSLLRGTLMKDPQPVPQGRSLRDTLVDVGILAQPSAGYVPPATPATPYAGTGEELQSVPPEATFTPGPMQSLPGAGMPPPTAPAAVAPTAPVAMQPKAAGRPAGPTTPEISPFDAGPLNEAFTQEQEAIANRAHLQEQVAIEQRKIQDESNAAMGELAKAHNDQIAANMALIQKTRADLAAAPIQRQSPGIGGAIAMALGAFGSSLSKSPNFAMQIINKAIDDDLAVQIQNRNDRTEKTRLLLQQYGADRMGIDDAFKVAKADRLAQAAGAMESVARTANSQEAMIAAQQASAQLMVKSQQLLVEAQANHFKLQTAPIAFRSEMRTADLQRRHIQQQIALAGQPKRPTEKEAVDLERAKVELDEAKRKGTVAFPSYRRGADGDLVQVGQTHRKLLNSGDTETPKSITRINNSLDVVKRFDEFFKPGFRAGPNSNQEFAGLKRELLQIMKQPGENSDSDVDRLAESLPSISTWSQLTGKPDTAIRALRTGLISELETIRRTALRED